MSRIILKRLGYKKEYIDYICFLIKNHDTPISYKQISDDFDRTIKLFTIQKCDALAHHPDKLEKRIEYLDKIEKRLVLKK